MEEKNCCESAGKENCKPCIGSIAPFFIGIVGALIVGWWLFPQLLYSQQEQPIRFSHKVHMEDAGMACADCHSFNEDGSYTGFPSTEACAECHEEAAGEDPAEAKFIKEYVQKGKQVEWLLYQYQPDNVFFTHTAHNMEKCGECHEFSEPELCSNCHPNVAEMDTPPTHFQNRLTGYSKTTMKMWACEECHAIADHRDNTNANNACFTCHK